MEFIIIPVEVWNEADSKVKQGLHIEDLRILEEENKVVLHVEHYDILFPMTLSEGEEIVRPYPVYHQNDPEFRKLIDVVEE